MSGGEGVILVSSHALISRVTPESGLCGGTGGESEALCERGGIPIGIGSLWATDMDSSAVSVEDAVFGSLVEKSSRRPPSP
jgi:hypothetical protein